MGVGWPFVHWVAELILGNAGTAQGILAAVPPALEPWPGWQEFGSGLHETALQKAGELPAKTHE